MATAQTWVSDSVSMGGMAQGTSYPNDVFYSLRNGVQSTTPNNNWHLAFQMTPPGPYGNVSVLANHAQTGVQVYSLHKKASVSFASLSAADTAGLTGDARQLYNSDTSWNFGAFNRMAQSGNQFDYSWGMYDPSSHHVNGDSLYLIKADTSYYKVWIQQYKSTPADTVHWAFRIARLDGSEDTLVRIYRKNGFTNRLFAYYNVKTRTVIDREPARSNWDFVFTRYKELVSQGPVSMMYTVMGVLNNFDVTSADVRSSHPDTAQLQNYARTTKINGIGSDWKAFSQATNTWNLDTVSYFIKTLNTNEYYQLQFTRFDGSGTGKIVFRKRLISAPTAVGNITNNTITAFHMAPNPAVNAAQIMIDAKEAAANARLVVTDMSGRVVQQMPLGIRKGMNAYELNTGNFAAGTYVITIANGSWKMAEKLVVQH